MWHKLKDIFGNRDSRQQKSEDTGNEKNELDVENSTAEIASEESNENSTKVLREFEHSDPKSVQDGSGQSLWRQYKARWSEKDCFECKVTTSVVVFCIVIHLCNSLWKQRINLPKTKEKYIVITNMSLLGMWFLLMKREWYDGEQQKEAARKNSFILKMWEKYK